MSTQRGRTELKPVDFEPDEPGQGAIIPRGEISTTSSESRAPQDNIPEPTLVGEGGVPIMEFGRQIPAALQAHDEVRAEREHERQQRLAQDSANPLVRQ